MCKGETMVLCSACLPTAVPLTSQSCTGLGPQGQMAGCLTRSFTSPGNHLKI